jgi:hypothetical protein
MHLPNYFLADLPPEAPLSPGIVAEACQTLKRNRELYLISRTTQSLLELFHELGRLWLDPDYTFRRLALELGPEATGFARPTLESGLNTFFGQLTGENLQALLTQELGHAERMDGLIATNNERHSHCSAIARGPELIAHICAGNIPTPALHNLVLGLLVRSSQVVKCATGAALLPRLFAHSLYEAEPKLGACLEIATWRGGDQALEGALFEQADCVTATGSDETLAAIRKRLPVRARFLGYGHRVSFGLVTHEMTSGFQGAKIAAHAAADVVAWNQQGCLSPHVIYVEHGGRVSAEQFAGMLAAELAKLEGIEPRGAIPIETAASIASRRAFYEVRAAHSPETLYWFSDRSTAWTVIYEADPRFQISCLNRFVYVKGVTGLAELLQSCDPVRGQVSTVGLAAPDTRAHQIALELARWGVTRVCPIGQMQKPPLTWRHDGRPALGDLVTWTDWER